jgi:ribosomal protein L10
MMQLSKKNFNTFTFFQYFTSLMKDRLIELFSKAQKRNSKVMIRQGALSSASFTASAVSQQSHLPSSPPSHKSVASSSSAGSSVFPPPPPL